ncbi:MAG: cupredoxin domain-containing protein [Burkholderiales bacterium]
MMLVFHKRNILAIFVGVFLSSAALADGVPVILIHNAQFEPRELIIAPGVRTQVVVRNQDAIPAEFESYDLSREVVVPAHGEVSFFVGPAEAGRYEFFNDFNRDMKGVIVVKAAVGGH